MTARQHIASEGSHRRDATELPAFPRLAPAVPPYSMHLAYDLDDEIFIVTVPELPGCMTHGATRAEAVRKGEEAISSWLIAAEHWDTPIPAPAVVQFEAGLAEGEAAGPS